METREAVGLDWATASSPLASTASLSSFRGRLSVVLERAAQVA